VYKFKNSLVFLSILHEEKIKDVIFESGWIINIHCKTTKLEPYLFTIRIEYAKVPFHLSYFLKSLENSMYKTLLKEYKM
jgi:hypothetical protein